MFIYPQSEAEFGSSGRGTLHLLYFGHPQNTTWPIFHTTSLAQNIAGVVRYIESLGVMHQKLITPCKIAGPTTLPVFSRMKPRIRPKKNVHRPHCHIRSNCPVNGLNGFNICHIPKSNDPMINPQPQLTPKKI